MKKFMALVLVAAMCMCLFAGCGSSNSGTAATEAPAEASGSNTFKIGGSGPLTGDAAIYGTAVKNGGQIAVDEINANGGINGCQVEWKFEDDQADSEIAVNAYNNLMDWGMQVMAGPTTTGSSISVSTKCNEERVFMMTPSASSADVTAGKDNVYQLCFTDPNQGAGSATYIAANMPESKIAVIYRNDDAYSQGIRDKFVSTAAENGLEIVYEGTFTKDTATDFSVQLNAAQADGADLVFLPIYYQPASVIAMIDPGDYKKHLLLMFENGKAARIELSAYETKTNRRKLVGACSDKSPVKAVMLIGEEFDVACYSSDGRAMIFNTALLQPKTSRSTQGVAVMSLKAKRVLDKAMPLKDSDIQNTARYRVRSIPAAGALIKGEDRAEKQLSLMDE